MVDRSFLKSLCMQSLVMLNLFETFKDVACQLHVDLKNKRWDPIGMHALITMLKSPRQLHSLAPKVALLLYLSQEILTNNKGRITRGILETIQRIFFMLLAIVALWCRILGALLSPRSLYPTRQ
ncbi:hypothetical protein VNO77_29984 [Canavalia gladiata]|uniref:Uncharacterized protein n=1 Tax=Canavalia gladiata TaxID=3824 RepID=A0AAN9Q6X7_CANGL